VAVVSRAGLLLLLLTVMIYAVMVPDRLPCNCALQTFLRRGSSWTVMMGTITEAGRGMTKRWVPSAAARKNQQEAQQRLVHLGESSSSCGTSTNAAAGTTVHAPQLSATMPAFICSSSCSCSSSASSSLLLAAVQHEVG
jgi:hypothetical protein